MRAMLLREGSGALQWSEVPAPVAGAGQVLVKVSACAVCRTDLHVIDGELPNPKLPLVPGHEIVGRVAALGTGVVGFAPGDRVGIPWLGWTCGKCGYCLSGRENLCGLARFTGYTMDGGFAEYTVADARYCFRIPDAYSDAQAAPLLCAGLIGYRSFLKAGAVRSLGIYGFGAAAHILTQIARQKGCEVFAFTRPGDLASQQFAKSMGAVWVGDANTLPPEKLDAAILFAPAGELVPQALRAVAKGGTVVCGGIHMSDIPSFPYRILWEERSVCSVANLTRCDGEKFMAHVARAPVRVEVETFALADANEALARLKSGRLQGAAVLLTG